MKKEHIMDAMDYIDPALVAAADERGRTRLRAHWLRPALVAACLCATLVGTVAAMEIIGVRINWQADSSQVMDGYSAYGVEGGITYFPEEDFSQEVRELAENEDVKYFSDWDELEQFLGWDLLDNPVLESFMPGSADGHILLCTYGGEQGFFHAMVTDVHMVDNGSISVIRTVDLYTDNVPLSDREGEEPSNILACYPKDSQVTQTQYTTAGGLSAVIVESVLQEADGTTNQTSEAYLSVNGVRYTLTVLNDMKAAADTTAVLKQVLDGFDAN